MALNALTSLDYSASSPLSERSSDEVFQFKQLQEQFATQFQQVFPDKLAPRTVIIIPSLTLDQEILEKIDGVIYYEERLLCLLMLLRMPMTRVVYITSMPVDPVIVDYYLHLLPGITGYHARQRLTLLSCFDSSSKSLTQKILERPRLIQRIKNQISSTNCGHLACFNVTGAERSLAVQLQVPVYGCDPDLLYLGTKSTGRKLFRSAGINIPDGYEDLFSETDIVQALVALKQKCPSATKAVIKVNEGFSGEGNALFNYQGAPVNDALYEWVKLELPRRIKIVARQLSFSSFMGKIRQMGGVVEMFVDGAQKQSPSVQIRIDPLGKIEVLSTHDQLLDGESGQVFLGGTFPADSAYATEIGLQGRRIAEELKSYGVLGRFSIDFISVKEADTWIHYAIEINLRKGGTTHPYLMLQFLTDGEYDAAQGKYFTLNGQERSYFCSDNIQKDQYKGLTPHDLIEVAMCNGLLYDGASQEGVMFHLISTLSQYGKLGLICIGASPGRAEAYYQRTLEVLDRETGVLTG